MEETKKNEREKSEKLLPLYYKENGRIVYTEQFHINRGYCCGQGCRHCPYEPKHTIGNISLSKKYG